MTFTIDYPVDSLDLAAKIAAGWTTLTLWYADNPAGPYTDSGATVSPTTLALMSSGEDYTATFTWASGSAAYSYKVRGYDGANYSDLNDSKPFNGGGGTTLRRLRRILGTRVRDLTIGTTSSSGGTTTANCTDLNVVRWPNDYFNDAFFHRLTATEVVTQVADFVKSGGVFTLSPAVATVGSGVDFEVTKRWHPDEYRECINLAIANVYPYLHRKIVNTSGLTTADTSGNPTMVYAIPQDILWLSKVEIEDPGNITSTDSAIRGRPWHEIPFKPVDNGGIPSIELRRGYTADQRLRFSGIGRLSSVYLDTDFTEVFDPQTELILYLAAHYLYAMFPGEAASTDTDRWDKMSQYWFGLYEKFRDQYAMPRPAQMIWNWDSQVAGHRSRSELGIAR